MTPRHSIAVTTQPSVEPVTLAELKGHCRVEHDSDNALLVEWGKAARSMVEAAAGGRKLLTQTVRVQMADFPANGEPIRLPVWPVQAVTGVTYRRSLDGAETALTGFQTWLDHDPPLLAPPVADSSWPFVDERYLNAVTITLTAGETSVASVPGHAKQAILLTVGYWHGFRGDGRDPAEAESIPGEAGLPAGAVRLVDLLTQKRYG